MDLGHSTRMLLRYLLAHPDRALRMTDAIRRAGVPRGTIGGLVHRLASIGWVEFVDSDDPRLRPFRLTDAGVVGARTVLARADRTPGRTRVWTMRELRDAVDRGEQPAGLLEAAEAAIAESRREAKHRRA